ncbi:hypothetical protein DFH05DRAFT_1485741 [Lentinula detonsa]|uniref:Uncharacterized protein n=1 Tax=Lentinula detonsa TaxID=2804962 RepID=A0A9W8P4F0_9AGAR|nr:hypothetical protein DFH05DRAFT_1485741 [Lentinula detonsa]
MLSPVQSPSVTRFDYANVRGLRRSTGDCYTPELYSASIANGYGTKSKSTMPGKLLKPLIPQEHAPVTLGLLTPVEEIPDEAEATSSKAVRPLPIPNQQIDSNRPRARTWATWSDDSQLILTSTIRNNVIQIIPESTNDPALVASTNDSSGLIKRDSRVGSKRSSGALEMLTARHHNVPPSKCTLRSNSSRPREGRSLTVSNSLDAEFVISVRRPAPQLPHSDPPTPSERQFFQRERANTNAAVPRRQIQNWIASANVASNAASSAEFKSAEAPSFSPRSHNAKVKALPSPPVAENATKEIQARITNQSHITRQDKGKGKAVDSIPQFISQEHYHGDKSGYGLLTPPDSAPALDGLALSGLRGTRPRGPRPRRSTIS